MATNILWATRPFDYAGKALDRGQVVALTNARNDEKLLRLGYVREFNGTKRDLVTCDECGELFIGHDSRIGHYKKRHDTRELDPEEEDRQVEREERMLEAVAPLNLDQTAANRGG